MLLSEKLYPHLLEIDETAQSRLEQMMPQLVKEAGATEELKASDPMKWVGLMNTCKAQAEEILMAELIPVSYTHLDVYKRQVWAIWLVWPTPTLITRTTPSGAMTICPFCRNPGRWW